MTTTDHPPARNAAVGTGARRLWSFPGGIHPPQEKAQSNTTPIQDAGLPEELVLPVRQHIGADAEPCVRVGEPVLKGQPLALPSGLVSVGLHAPTSAVVAAIEPRPVPHPSGLDDICIVLRPDGEERWVELAPATDWRQRDPAELLERIRSAGIAGMGGAGFPTATKLGGGRNGRLHTLILNGVECEPYITADDALMRHRADAIIAGAEMLMYISGTRVCLVAVEDNKPEAIAALAAAMAAHQVVGVELVVIPTRYPSGGEKQLIQILTGQEVPSGRLPSDLGLLCQNVGTAVAIQRALDFGEPLISRVTTVTGHAVSAPGNFDVLLGTPFSHLLERAGLDEQRLARLVMGGSMMGVAVAERATPVVKTTNCLLAATLEEFPDPAPEMPCIRCGMCETVCPASLLPQQLYWFARAGDLDAAREHDIADCIECGACAWVCPSAIPLVQYYRHTKGAIRQQDVDSRRAERSRERFEHHKTRIEAEAADREARRRARAEAARRKAATAAGASAAAASADAADAVVAPPSQTPAADAEASKSARASVVAAALARARGDAPKVATDDHAVAPTAPMDAHPNDTIGARRDDASARTRTLAERIDRTRATLVEVEASGDALRAGKLQAKLKGMEARLEALRAEQLGSGQPE